MLILHNEKTDLGLRKKMPSQKITSSRELAKVAGVSHMTVSRAFRGTGISAAARERILKIAEEHGYRPNPIHLLHAQAKHVQEREESLGTLAFVHFYSPLRSWSMKPHLAGFLQGMQEQAKASGFAVDEFLLGKAGYTHTHLAKVLESRGIQGVIFGPAQGFMKRVHFDWKKFSCVTFNHDSWRPLLHRVSVDEMYKIAVVLREVKRLGYRRIGLALTKNFDAINHHGLTGALLVHNQSVPARDRIPPLTYKGAWITDSVKEVKAWLKRYRPDCLICGDVTTMDVVKSMRIKVPEDLGLVHLNIGPDVADWTGYHVEHRAIGAAAVDMVINRLVRNERGIPSDSRELLLRGVWKPGKTTRKQASA